MRSNLLVVEFQPWNTASSVRKATLAQWESAWAFPTYYFGCFNILLSNFKLSARWYLTPLKMSLIHKKLSPLCWKGCGQWGSFYHCWWLCKFVSQFWSHILALIQQITGIKVAKDPLSILLNISDHTNIPNDNRELVFLLLLAAKSSIAFN